MNQVSQDYAFYNNTTELRVCVFKASIDFEPAVRGMQNHMKILD